MPGNFFLLHLLYLCISMGRIYKRRRTKRKTSALRKKIFSRKRLKKSRSVQKFIFGKKLKIAWQNTKEPYNFLRNLLFHKNVLWTKKKKKKKKKKNTQSIKLMIKNQPFAGNMSASKFTCMFGKIRS